MSKKSEQTTDGNEGTLRLRIRKDTIMDLTPEQQQQVRGALAAGEVWRPCVIYEFGDTTRYCK